MEINFEDEDPSIEIINNNKVLHYLVKDNGKNVKKVPVFKQWLDLVKSDHGDNGIICYCVNCHFFFYFENMEQKNMHNHSNCYSFDMAEFCEYCEELCSPHSICCFRAQYKIFKRIIYREFHLNREDYLYIMPFIIIMFYFANIFEVIYYKRKKGQDINNIKDYTKDGNGFIGIFALFLILYSLIFFIPYTYIYLFQFLFAFKIRNQLAKDKEENFYRY